MALILGLSLSFLLVMFSFIHEERAAIIDIGMNTSSQMVDSMDELYSDIKEDTDSIIVDSFVQKCIVKNKLNVKEEENLLHNLLTYTEDVQGCTYYIKNSGEVYSYSGGYINTKNSHFEKLLNEDYAKVHLFWQSTSEIYKDKVDNSVGMYVIRNIRSIDTLAQPDCILIEIQPSKISQVLQVNTDERFNYFIAGPDKKIYAKKCFHKIDDTTLTSIQEAISNQKMVKLQDGYVFNSYHKDSDMYLVSYISDAEVYQSVKSALGWMFIFMGTAIIFAIVFSFTASLKLSEPVQMISNEMQEFSENSLSKEMYINTNTELDEIGKSYNTMLRKIKYLMNQVQDKEKEARNLEMESLMYQIHPHFLYNTLENIYMLARINKQDNIMLMVDSLSKLLRITLSNGHKIISIQDELTHVKSYLDIQKYRNNNLFEYEIICQDNLKNKKVPKLFLQPIVENSIKHGFSQMDSEGLIQIQVKSEYEDGNEKLIFIVSDNGKGMDEKSIHLLNEYIKNIDSVNPTLKEGGYGIKNVSRRLKLMCKNADIFYSCSDGMKCTIELVMGEDYLDEE